MRKGDGVDRQRAKVVGNFATHGAGEKGMQQTLMQFVAASATKRECGCRKGIVQV